ncbi:hypothetical protein [Pedobacter sp. SYSU D00535]|uniref:hypothetical protein n=1 Tax=Pedobacter sp. SYSU D00535 TaxID=2810308 RepID=UPI001A97C27E|nr:hypothetical protein [Pedobacter sp. SYSU D00535]
MKKLRCQSRLGLGLISLFLINCLLVACTLLSAHSLPAVAAILLASFQLFIHHRLQKNDGSDKGRRFINRLIERVWFYVPNIVSNGNKLRALTRAERILIKRRSAKQAVEKHLLSFAAQLDGLDTKGTHLMFDQNLKVSIGTSACKKPYLMSVLNAGVSSLSRFSADTIFSLSEASNVEGFGLATGIDGIRPEHIRGGGDLLWQFSLDYVTMKNFLGSPEELAFRRNSSRAYVKMIELLITSPDKAKSLNIPALFKQRIGKDGEDGTRSLREIKEILQFIAKLREVSGGKPVGIRIPIRGTSTLISLTLGMRQTGLYPDFITIDEELCSTSFSKNGATVQKTALELLSFSQKLFEKFRVPSALLFSGMVVTELDVLKALSLGASACISTLPMAYASRTAHSWFSEDPYARSMHVANYHRNIVAGLTALSKTLRASQSKNDNVPPPYFLKTESPFTAAPVFISARMKDSFPPIMNN